MTELATIRAERDRRTLERRAPELRREAWERKRLEGEATERRFELRREADRLAANARINNWMARFDAARLGSN